MQFNKFFLVANALLLRSNGTFFKINQRVINNVASFRVYNFNRCISQCVNNASDLERQNKNPLWCKFDVSSDARQWMCASNLQNCALMLGGHAPINCFGFLFSNEPMLCQKNSCEQRHVCSGNLFGPHVQHDIFMSDFCAFVWKDDRVETSDDLIRKSLEMSFLVRVLEVVHIYFQTYDEISKFMAVAKTPVLLERYPHMRLFVNIVESLTLDHVHKLKYQVTNPIFFLHPVPSTNVLLN